MENAAIARVLGEIADLLEIRGENPFRIRAYRNASLAVADAATRLATLSDAELRTIPGIGKDISARVRELIDTGGAAYHEELKAEFPAGLIDLLRLQGVGPKTVALLHRSLGIGSIDELAAAIAAGRLRGLKGMGTRKEEQLLKAITDRRQLSGRHIASVASLQADLVVTQLRTLSASATFDVVGSLRRGTDLVGDVDILATVEGGRAGTASVPLMDAFVKLPGVDRVLGHGETKSSVLLARGLQADLRVVAPEERGAAQQYFTGSKAHNIELRDRAIRRGYRLNEYGLFSTDGDVRVAGDTEASIYEALGLPWIAPELREGRGEFQAAERGALPHLIAWDDVRGDLHCHTTETDGKDTLEGMVEEARRRGYQYVAITDHSQALAMANGLDERRALAHAARIRALDARYEDITVLAGIECDIRADGRLDLAEDCLAALDVVVASVHSAFTQSEAEMTERVLRALECPWVDILGHATGRALLRREASELDVERVIDAAVTHGVALEINGQPHRRDLHDIHARLAVQRGARLVLSSDAHSRANFDYMRWATLTARRAWVTPTDVLNTQSPTALRASLRRHRRGGVS